jgi:hypothetical protein
MGSYTRVQCPEIARAHAFPLLVPLGRYTRVQCPEGLYRLSGLRRSDDGGYPRPSLSNPLTQSCNGNRQTGK